MKISVIIPIYNEKNIIASSVKAFADYMRENFDDYELIFSDDGSTDGCGDIVLEAAKNDEHIILSRYEKNRGKGCAVRTGMLKSTGDISMFTDCDIAYGLDIIKDVYNYFEENKDADLVIGSRNLKGDGYEGYTLIRKIASKTYIKVLGLAAGFKLSDSQCGLKAFKTNVAHDIFSRCITDGFAFDIEVILFAKKLKYKICEIPVKIINHRESSVHLVSDTIKMLKDLRIIKKHVKKS